MQGVFQMSKKQKRTNYQGSRRSTQTSTPAATPSSSVENTPQSPARSTYSTAPRTTGSTRSIGSMSGTGSRRFMPAPEFKPDYSYVKRDLKRIGIIAGSFFGILIVLSFFLK
jgi:hypothetical protein